LGTTSSASLWPVVPVTRSARVSIVSQDPLVISI
jgi:hypothetical protein